MNRFDELLNRFPEIPRNIVLKTDLLRQGIRYTPVLKEVGEWALPKSLSVYHLDHEYSHTSKEDATRGWVNVPFYMLLNDETFLSIELDGRSPYEIRGENDKYMLYLGETPIEQISFPSRPKWYSKTTSNGTLMANVGYQSGDLFTVFCSNFCEYFSTGDQCRFCSLNTTLDVVKDLGIERKAGRNVVDFVETYAEASKETHHIALCAGGLQDRRKEARQYIKLMNGLKEAGFQPPQFMTDPQALEEEDARKFQELGVEVMGYNMEVWQEHMWPIIVPGKNKFVGRDTWIASLLKAVEIFGRGNVFSVFVGGIEMLQPHGYKDIDEAVKSTLVGFEWLIDRGIFPRPNVWFSDPGSSLAGVEPPPTEYYLKLGWGLHKLQKKHALPSPKTFCHKCEYVTLFADYERIMPVV